MTTPDSTWAAPIWVDFMAMDGVSRVPLDYPGTAEDLERHRIDLREGLRLALYSYDATENDDDDPLIGLGSVEYDPSSGRWFATVDVNALMHLTDLGARHRSIFLAARDIRARCVSR